MLSIQFSGLLSSHHQRPCRFMNQRNCRFLNQLSMADRKRRRFQRYLRDPEYAPLGAAESASSSATFGDVSALTRDGLMSDAMWLVFKHISTIKHGEAAGGASMVRHVIQCKFPCCMRSVGGSMKHLFEPDMLKKHRTHTYLVGNASVQFTMNALVRDWATIEAEDDPSATDQRSRLRRAHARQQR